jgi:DNA polymerase-3 subunit beta
MIFESTSEKLKRGVSVALRCVSKNITLPTLEYLLLIVDKNSLTIRATNLSIGSETVVAIKSDTNGTLAIRGDILLSFLSNTSTDEKVTCEQRGDLFIVKTKNNTVTLKTFPYDDFPTLPKLDQVEKNSISSEIIVDGFKVCSL